MPLATSRRDPSEPPDWCFDMNEDMVPSGILLSLAITAWRVSLTRRVARDAGLDPDRATELTLLEDHGLEASYLAAHLQARPVTEQPSPPAVRSAEERLRELRSLLESGLISQEEHDARRKAVVDAL